MDTLRVLITDDEPGIRLAAKRSLRGLSIDIPDVEKTVELHVEEAESGEAAVEKILVDPPDILLLDYKMPGISGLDVLDRICAMDHMPLTIMITAYASIETAVTATKRGAHDFLPKPFTPTELKAVVRKAATHLVLAAQARNLDAEKRQARFELIRMLGHELQTPLNVVDGYLELIRDGRIGTDRADLVEYLDRSRNRIDGMRRMISDLLAMTRIEASRQNRRVDNLNLGELAREVIDAFQPEIERSDVTLNLRCAGRVDFAGDREEIVILLNNLISNAIKYNRDSGRVDVSLTGDDQVVTIGVTDTGIGISDDEVPQLFSEFVRIKNEKTRHILGSGLGLSIVKRLATLYDGDVNVESQVDVGTTFTVTLRRAKATAELS